MGAATFQSKSQYCLGLDGGRRGGDLRSLGGGKLLEARRSRRLVLLRRRQVALHLLKHGLQHAHDLAGGLRTLLTLQEGGYALALVVVDRRRRGNRAQQDRLLGRAHLHERTQALLESRDRALHRRDVRRHVRGGRVEVRLLLLADARRLLLVLLRRLAGRLVVLELLLKLSLLRLQGFQLRAQFRGLLRALRSSGLHAIGVTVTVAHELVVGLLFLLAFGLDFLLHILQEGNDPPDGVLLLPQAVGSRGAPAAGKEKREEKHPAGLFEILAR